MKKRTQLIYAAGPGDVISTYRHWKAGKDDPLQVSMTYSGQFFDVCRDMDANGYVISYHPNEAILDDGTVVVEHRRKPFPGRGGLFYHFSEIWYGLRFVLTAIRIRADLAVVAEGTTHWRVLALLSLFRIKLIPTVHCVLWPKFSKLDRRQRLINRLSKSVFARHSAALLSASNDISKQLSIVAGGTARPILTFLPTYRVETFSSIPPPPAELSPFGVLFGGRVEENKGVFILLEVAIRCRAEGRRDIRFDICGTGGALDELRRRAKEAGVSDVFVCHGHCRREVMQDMLSRSHVIVVPTTTGFTEGYNQAVVEGVLAGRPVVSSAVCPSIASLPDAVVEAPPDDPKGYGDAIIRLREDRRFYEEKRQGCFAYQAQFYDAEQGWYGAFKTVLQAVQDRREVQAPLGVLPGTDRESMTG
jgi:glycogen synthase